LPTYFPIQLTSAAHGKNQISENPRLGA